MMGDKAKATRLIKTARGQMDGIIKMIEEDRYCIDISNQIMACQAIMSKVNKEILQAHIGHCVMDACGEQGKDKVAEIAQILDKLL